MNARLDKLTSEAIKLTSDLVEIQTVNPPGNETEAAKYLLNVLETEGIEGRIYESAPGRGSLVARMPGSGHSKPLILLGHIDVVNASPKQWKHDPFKATIDDGYLWGRGTLDMKGMAAMEVLALLQLKRAGITPKRDIILIASADEEAGATYGMEYLMKQDIPGLKNAEYVINEGGEGTIRDDVPVYSCQNGEKGVLWVKIIVPGTPGHASMPAKDNAIQKMAQIINRIARKKRPITLCETTRGYLTELAIHKGLSIANPPNENTDLSLQLFANRYFKNERSVQAMLYNTVSPTIVKAGDKANVLPELCEVTLDCRLLPGESPDHFYDMLVEEINDPTVKLEIIHAAAATESSYRTELFDIMKKAVKQDNPNSLLVPLLSPGGTDSRYFRNLGITAYGFIPILISEEELQRMHGIDERISLENLGRGTRILHEVVREIVER